MSRDADQIIAQRTAIKKQFKGLFSQVESIFFRHDPIGIAFTDDNLVADNPDEYAPEVETVLPRLHTANSANDVTDIIYEEFARWFGADEVGNKQDYTLIAEEVWRAWNDHQNTNEATKP